MRLALHTPRKYKMCRTLVWPFLFLAKAEKAIVSLIGDKVGEDEMSLFA